MTMTDINMNAGNKSLPVSRLVELTLGRLETAGYEIVYLDKEIEGAAEIKVSSFDDYIKLINRASVKFIFVYKFSGMKEVAERGAHELKTFNLIHLMKGFEDMCKELKEKYKDSYVNLYANIDGVTTIVRLKFINKDMVDILSDLGDKIGHTFIDTLSINEKGWED